jgi:hypothetical protein
MTEEVNRKRTVPFALFSEHVLVPTAIVPPEGFETKMKQVLSQPIKLRQKTSAVKKPRREALVAPREVHMRRMERSRCQDYGGGNNCSQVTGSKTSESVDQLLEEGRHNRYSDKQVLKE